MENIVLSGQPSIIIKCGCDFEVNNIKFKEDQVIACITDCNVDFAYTAANRSARQGAGLLNYSESVELSEITNLISSFWLWTIFSINFGTTP